MREAAGIIFGPLFLGMALRVDRHDDVGGIKVQSQSAVDQIDGQGTEEIRLKFGQVGFLPGRVGGGWG